MIRQVLRIRLIQATIAVALAAFVSAGAAQAHMMTIETRDVAGVRVLMGYFADGAYADVPLTLMLGLATIPQEDPVDFKDVTVQIAPKGAAPILDDVFAPEDRVAYVDHSFTKPGEYEIRVSFKGVGETTIEAIFSLDVIPNPAEMFDRVLAPR
jgi:hypothetical protein